ncbi:PAS domain S-box protein [Nodosilinea sp. PGN35]|uniref:PAS domain S-box protein n=1 Tax=Nodosilinea sp. PGN35 TaxID=3020489 RepID=UPI0023B2F2A2|nr:PAS domain S-box protein [Nodosilinea sp. TSF1-S3]MDF0367086.1 PAS domain S-box protein [Nodosilinea sp. TSF1-S3]
MKVLVVEDEATVAQAIEALLVSHRYAVDIATDGLEGLEMAEAYSYDLMLLDIGLPGIDGMSLCQRLRSRGMQTPVLLLTGQDVEAHAKAVALNAGADDYVTKPFDAEELLARLQTLLRRGDLKALPVLQWGALSLDPSRLQVSYGNALLNLTPKEYTLLEVLLRHAPNILSAFAILEQGWNALENPSDEAIRTHVKEVRKKLKAAGAPEDFIKTVHRQGYRLNPLYGEAAFAGHEETTSTLQLAELKAVNEELRLTLEQLRTTQAELQQSNQELQAAREELEARVAERTTALSEREAFLSSIYEGVNQPIFVVAVTERGDFRYLSHNRAAEEVTGIALRDVRDKTPEELFGLEIGAQFRQNYARCVRANRSVVSDNHFVFQGRSVWTLTTLSPLRDATGKIDRLVGTVLDISDRKRAEATLTASEAKYRTLFSEIDEGYCIAEILLNNSGKPVNYRILEANPRFEELTALPLEVALSGRTIREIAPELEEHWYQLYGNVALTGEPIRFEQQAAGWNRWYDVYAFRIGAPELRQVAILFNDISDRKSTELALRQSEDRYRQLVELTPQLVWHADAQGHTYISPQLSEYTGLSPEQLLEFGWPMVMHPDDVDRIGRRWQESMQTGVPYEAEYRLRRADGEYRWHLARAMPTDGDRDVQWFGVSTDIHDRQQLEEALRASEAQLSRIFDNVGAAIGEFSAYADRTYVHGVYSAGCEAVYGYSQAEMTGDSSLWLSRVLPEDVETVILPSYEQIFAEANFAIEYRFRDKTDTIRWIAETLVSRWDAAAACWQVTAMAIDISDRKQLELSLQASEAKLSQIINSAIAAIASFRLFSNRDWSYDYFSAGCAAVFGYTAQELMDNPQLWWSRVWPSDRETVLMPLVDELLAERDVAAEFRFRHRDGSLRWISSSHTSRRIDDDCWLVTVVNSDISDRKQAELALQQQVHQEQLLADIAQEIRQSLDLNQVLHSTVERVRAWLECDRVIIFRFHPDWQGDVIMESVGDGWPAILDTTIVDPCFEDRFIEPFHQGHVSVLNDIHQPGLEPCYVQLLAQFQVQASVAVPILQGHGLWGLLIVHHCAAPRPWQAAEITILKRLSTQVGIAIQQAELYEQIRQELTQRARMQAVLQESEERFRSLSAAAPVGILQTNADGICLYANGAWQQMSGLSLENSLGNGWLQAIHPDDRAWVFRAWEAYLEQQREGQAEFRLLTPQQETRWISARAAAIASATAEIAGYVSTYEDITERKQAEQALRDSEQRLQAILDHSPAIIYLIDAQNRHLLVNRSYADQLATTPDHLVGKTLHEVWPEETADSFAARNQTIFATGQLLQLEDTAPLADGIHSYITVKFPLVDATGTPYAICGISTDITEKKRLEAQFYQAQRLESLGTLAGGIAHDLNNVLTPILTVAQVLQLTQKGLGAKGLEQLKLLETSAKRGANLVKQILSVTRASQGEPTAVDLAALLREEVEIMRQSLPKAIALRVNLPAAEASEPALGTILADPTYLHQIVLNLCINARDAMANGGTLTLSAETVLVDEAMAAQNLDAQVGPYAAITVADTGTGIAPEVQERMFDPFFTTKAPGQGTGLGLATVRGLVKANQGFLQVVSEVGQGTQFKVYFPLMAGQAAEQKPPAIASPPTSDSRGALVLVVEDEAAVRQMLRSLLESHHYRPLLAENGAAALDLYRQHRGDIQLVVTDIMMPLLDGLTLIESLRTLNPEIPIIALSGLPRHGDPALGVGATYFLNKPFTAESLLTQVAIALHEGNLVPPDQRPRRWRLMNP